MSPDSKKTQGLCLLGILLLSVFTFSHNLGERDFFEDEYQVISAAHGYLQTGDYVLWDWIADKPRSIGPNDSDWEYYERAWPHTFLVAQSFSIFGMSETSARAISVVFSIVLVALAYFFTRFFIGRVKIALAVAFTLALTPSVIDLAQYTRMYAVLAPLFLLVSWTLYRGITEEQLVGRSGGLLGFLQNNFNFHYGYLALSAGLLGLGYEIHLNSLVLLPAAYLFVCYLALATRERRYVLLTGIGTLAILGLVAAAEVAPQLDVVTEWLTLFQKRQTQYLAFVTGSPFRQLGPFLLLIGLSGIVLIREREQRHRWVYLYAIVGFTLVFFVLIADRYPHSHYTSHVTPIALVLTIATCFAAIEKIRFKLGRVGVYGLFAVWVLYQYVPALGTLYGHDHDRGRPSLAYTEILDRFQPDRDVIFGQYLRSYYLRDLPPQSRVIRMLRRREYSLERFLEDSSQETSGFVTWETRKSKHLTENLREHIEANSQHLAGSGLDETGIEIYYFEASGRQPD